MGDGSRRSIDNGMSTRTDSYDLDLEQLSQLAVEDDETTLREVAEAKGRG